MTNMYSTTFQGSRRTVDSGLREYMLKVYNLMSLGLAISGLTAYLCVTVPAITALFFDVAPNGMILGMSGLGTLATIAPIGIALYFFMGAGRMTLETSQALFFVYAALTGISISVVGFVYTEASIAKTFLITASIFGGMSIYGNTTKTDLTSMGSFMIVGLWGIIIASIINIFMRSPAVDFATSALGIVIFVGLTAYDTQKLKQIYYASGGGEFGQKMAVLGAFTLYLDFINLFLYLIRFLGARRND